MRILAAFFLLAVSAFAASAQTAANGEKFGDWTLRCVAKGVGETSCALAQTLNAAETGAFVAEVGLTTQAGENGAQVVMILLTPEGVALDLRPAYKVDEAAEQTALIWRACASGRCRAAAVLSAGEIAALKAGQRLIMAYQAFGAPQPIRIAISLNGVSAGLAALGQ